MLFNLQGHASLMAVVKCGDTTCINDADVARELDVDVLTKDCDAVLHMLHCMRSGAVTAAVERHSLRCLVRRTRAVTILQIRSGQSSSYIKRRKGWGERVGRLAVTVDKAQVGRTQSGWRCKLIPKAWHTMKCTHNNR